ncbi:MAG: type II toxin-antitoxin system RelE/ParE family toxin [Candidatus Thioglobus sp.]|nr:type II toxin-antitoxin system RelE/ParE family toxin [Candidatus Thioglobus sp.]
MTDATYQVRYTQNAKQDIKRLYDFLLKEDISLARRAFEKIQLSISLLENFPFSGRKVFGDNSYLRELLIPFGASGYVALFRIQDKKTLNILAVRHQKEVDYY